MTTPNATRRSTESALLLAVLLGGAAAVTWWWRATIDQAPSVRLPRESWERVKQEYPMDEGSLNGSLLSHELAQVISRANPFDPQRRAVEPTPTEPTETSHANPPPRAVFVYKGRVHMGGRQRAIVEDSTSQKTYFLEVGQEVAGFKVLDITSERVILSDPQTSTEVIVSLTDSREGGTDVRQP